METILLLLPSLMSAGKNIFEYVAKLREAAKQADEWTPALEAQFQSLLNAAKADPAWQPD